MDLWSIYEKAVDKHNTTLFRKYFEDSDTSLLFVSMPMSRYLLFASTEFCSCVRRLYSRPLPPRLLFRSFHNFNRIPQISQTPSWSEYWNRTPRSAEPTHWPPSLISPSALSEPSPSSSLVYPSHYSWPSSRCWGNSGPCILFYSGPGGVSSKGGGVT